MTPRTPVSRARAGALLVLTCLAILTGPVAAPAEVISGDLDTRFEIAIPESGGYASPVNPGNVLGISDLAIRNAANLRVEGRGETGSIELRFDFEAIPVGATEIWSATISRATVSWYPTPWLYLNLGRQSFLSGYGYGWSPSDFVNPLRNPTDMNALVRGVDGLSVTMAPLWWFEITAFGILPDGPSSFDGIAAGGRITLNTPIAEVMVTGLYGGSVDEIDTHPHGAGAGIYVDLFGVGLYAEGAVRTASRRGVVDSAGSIEAPEGPVYSILAGAEYVFPSGFTATGEYFYNGEGWTASERDDYLEFLTSGTPTVGHLSLYTPASFSEHYVLLNLYLPLYGLDAGLEAATIYSIDSGALLVAPTFTANLGNAGNLSVELAYQGALSVGGSDSDEAALSPAGHGVAVGFGYAF